jgi:hypothetical protein
MRIEEGTDKDGTQCWFVLNGADLIGIFYTLEEAENNLANE